MSFNPTTVIDRRDDLDLIYEPLPASTGGGLYIRYGDQSAVIVVDPDIIGAARTAALTHELVHHERDGGAHGRGHERFRIDRNREETQVRRIAADRLVPLISLRRFCQSQAELGNAVGPLEVAVEYEVTLQVARQAIDNLNRWETTP